MRVSSRGVAALAAAAFSGAARAQCEEVVPGQYMGTEYANSVPVTHTYSEKAFFKIKDPSGRHVCADDPESDLSFLTYSSLNTTRQRPRNEDLKRAVIVLHGARRDPQNYHAGMILALLAVNDNDDISPDTVSILAPYFVNPDDAGRGYAAGSRALVWHGDHWAGGANNLLPETTQGTVSAFDVLDQIVQYYGDKTRFPNINQIVVGGHSMGAQMAQRYAAVGKTPEQLGITTPVSYYIGDPNSMIWFETTRPLSTSKCATYDNYREGFSNYLTYGSQYAGDMTYNTQLVSSGHEALLANYNSKTMAYGRATRDRGDYRGADDCAVYTTGKDRSERFFEFVKAFPPSCPDPATDGCHTLDIVESTHDAPTMFRAAAGQARLFKDNWDGDGSRAYDFGYPRWSEWDNPHPDPARADEPLIHTNHETYAGGMTDRGCFSDVDNAQSVGSLPRRPYVGTLNSRSYCSNACVEGGYRIAGMSGNYCYCGNALGRETVPVVSTSCEGLCPGNSSQICGGVQRLSILATGDL
ncbi:hypothetical protein DL764_007660 [Monosporascus ibericus]|uniref:WSC domain-containing protein n=1 Tax=Monosporascus ibericus TaxID=155417 RepID=A0A4Q4SZJ6_9PEZI|nr:hypothetical protein DL764_007660 [Monosporascus ibericus]